MMRSRLHDLAGAALLALAVVAAPAAAQAPQGASDDKLAAIRDDVKRLDEQGLYEAALKLLRGVVESSLDPVARLEWSQRVSSITAKQAARYEKERKAASDAEAAGRFDEAIAALDPVPTYGSEAQVAEAKGEQERIRAAAQKAEEDRAARAEEEKKRKAADSAADEKALKATVAKWLGSRRQLKCSKCNGARQIPCSMCGGTGQREVISGRVSPGTLTPKRRVPCDKCGGTGRVRCTTDNCGGTGFAAYKLEDAIWDVWPPAFQKELDLAVGSKKKYLDLMAERFRTGERSTPAIEACFDVLGPAMDSITRFESLELQLGGDGTATARYRVRLPMDERWEETRWRKVEAAWFMDPPGIPAEKAKPASTPR